MNLGSILLAAGLVCLVSGQSVADLLSINGFPVSELLDPVTRAPLKSKSPMSHRTTYYYQSSLGGCLANNVANDGCITGAEGNQTVSLFFTSTATPVNAPGDGWDVKFEAPYLEVAESTAVGGCTAAQALQGSCRCNVNPVGAFDYLAANEKTFARVQTNPGGFTTGLEFPIAAQTLTNYFEHPPVAGQDPYTRSYRKLCIKAPGANDWIDTTIWISITRACSTKAPTGKGLHCSTALPLTDFKGIVAPAAFSTVADFAGETPDQGRDRLTREFCCGFTPAEISGTETLKPAYGICINKASSVTGKLVQDCCGSKPFKPQAEKCCSKQRGHGPATATPLVAVPQTPLLARIEWHDTPCKCQTDNNDDCNSQGPSVENTVGTDIKETRNRLTARTTNFACCVRSKFGGTSLGLVGATKMIHTGVCYDTTDTRFAACCDDGNIYDPGTAQCCPLSGTQGLDTQCPCSAAADCPGNAGACCTQSFPLTFRVNQGMSAQCNKFANWPGKVSTPAGLAYTLNVDATGKGGKNQDDTGNVLQSGPDALQRQKTFNDLCTGRCYNPKFQTCCNGQTCVREYEKCCNASCCNRFSQRCVQGFKEATAAAGAARKNDWLDYRIPFEVCTEIENLTTQRAFLVYVLPTLMLFATLASLAIVVVVARRATEEIFELTERMIVLLSTILVFLATPFFFSPTYKYGVVVAFTGLFLIITAVIRSKRFSLTAIFIVVVLLLYLVDPFNGNVYLSLTGAQTVDESIGALLSTNTIQTNQYFGILHAVIRLSPLRTDDPAKPLGSTICTNFYHFFEVDPLVWDMDRTTNPVIRTFGYCSRAWITALVIFAAVIIALSLVLLMLAIFSFVKRMERKQQEYAPVHIEVSHRVA